MKKLLCLILACAVLMLSSCVGNGENNQSTVSQESSPVSYLPKEDSAVYKHFEENGLFDGLVLNMALERATSTDDCVINVKGDACHIAYTSHGNSEFYFTDGSNHYKLDNEKKIATLITGTTPDAIYIANYVMDINYSLFLGSETKEIDSVSYKAETFAYAENSEDTLTYYLKDDNSIAFIEYVSVSDAKYNVKLIVNSLSNAVDETLVAIPEDFTVANE